MTPSANDRGRSSKGREEDYSPPSSTVWHCAQLHWGYVTDQFQYSNRGCIDPPRRREKTRRSAEDRVRPTHATLGPSQAKREERRDVPGLEETSTLGGVTYPRSSLREPYNEQTREKQGELVTPPKSRGSPAAKGTARARERWPGKHKSRA